MSFALLTPGAPSDPELPKWSQGGAVFQEAAAIPVHFIEGGKHDPAHTDRMELMEAIGIRQSGQRRLKIVLQAGDLEGDQGLYWGGIAQQV
jgi:hypothetical protein